MKYMGSKRAMLTNGLGEALERSVFGSTRVLDLFSGSAAVACYVAEKYDKQVIASDLQRYSVCLASAVIERNEIINNFSWLEDWFERARSKIISNPHYSKIEKHQSCLGTLDVRGASERALDFKLGEDYP